MHYGHLCYNHPMAELKTKVNDASVTAFINAVPDDAKREDSFTLLEIFRRVTGQEPKMWGTAIIGFGQYHYKSERSSQEGDWPLVSFSPRKQNLTLYIMSGFTKYEELLAKLGKHKTGKSCLYIKRLSDIDENVLTELIESSIENVRNKHIQY